MEANLIHATLSVASPLIMTNFQGAILDVIFLFF